MSLRTVIIGAGGRILETVLPAMEALGDRIALTQIHARSAREIPRLQGGPLTTSTDLSSIRFDQTDLLILAVPTHSIGPILRELRPQPNRGETFLLLDTPPLRFSDLRRRGLFQGYRAVGVGEDWSYLAPVLAARQIIREGQIGDIRAIEFAHCGYRYHALAAFKTLADVRTVSSIRRRQLGVVAETNVKLGKNRRARIVEPRDYAVGRMLILGTQGLISDFPLAPCENRTQVLLGYPQAPHGWFQPLEVNGERTPMDAVEAAMADLPMEWLLDPSPTNRLKIRAYAKILEMIAGGENPYPVVDGIYDYFAISLAEKFGYFVDFSWGRGQQSLWRWLLGFHGRT